MGYQISIGLWKEGEELSERGKVKKIRRQACGQTEELIGASVECAFGFVHHPFIRYEPQDRKLTGFICDCWQYKDANSVCVHCVALLANKFATRSVTVTATAQENKRLAVLKQSRVAEEGESPAGAERVEIMLDRELNALEREVRGKIKVDFGFVHHPMLTLRDGAVVDFHCDCYQFAEHAGMCSHCEALLHRLEWADRQQEQGEKFDFTQPMEEDNKDSVPERTEPETLCETAECACQPEVPVEPTTMQVFFGQADGTDTPVFWYPNDTEQLVHVNTGIIGTMGTGKTQLTKSIVTQLVRQQGSNYDASGLGILVFDYKGDYNLSKRDFVQATGATVLNLHRLPFNPFSLRALKRKPQLPYHVASGFAGILTKIYHLGPVQHNTLLKSIIAAYDRCGITSDESTWGREAPTFEQVYQVYCEQSSKQDALYSAMYTLHQFEIFEQAPGRTDTLYSLLDGVVVLDLSGYNDRIQNLVVAITLELFYSQMLNAGSSRSNSRYRQMKKLILVDEADNIMAEDFPALKSIMKEGREFGVGTILSTQSLRHFGAGSENYSPYILTWVVHAVPDLKRSDVEYILRVPSLEAEQLSQQMMSLKKHHSIAKLGNTSPICITDLPFWKICEDCEQSYLYPQDGVKRDEE